ncbi:MAG: DMT family transporter [Parachlamydiaceae bacterium]|nr:DMT family transporter [Parachlamydiaceae bacterium]
MFPVMLLYALFASVFTIAKTGLDYAQPLFLVGSRMLFAGIIMLAYQFFCNRKEFTFKKEHFWRVFRLALFNIYLTNVFEFWGLKYLTSFKTCFIYSLSPFISAILSYFLFADKISLRKGFGLAIGFFGFLPILMCGSSSSEDLTGRILFLSWAEVAVIFAAISSVYGWILLKQLVSENGYSPFMANGLSMTLGGTMALFHSSISETWDPLPVSQMFPFLECALLLILVSNLICYNLYGYLLKRYSATFISFAGFTTPFFTALFGWFFLGEIVTWPFYLSAAIVLAGLYTFYQEELKQEIFQSKNRDWKAKEVFNNN